MSAENAIIMQTAAKVAAEITAALNNRNPEEAVVAFKKCFDGILTSMLEKLEPPRTTTGGRAIKIISSEDIKSSILNVKTTNQQAGTKVSSTVIDV